MGGCDSENYCTLETKALAVAAIAAVAAAAAHSPAAAAQVNAL